MTSSSIIMPGDTPEQIVEAHVYAARHCNTAEHEFPDAPRTRPDSVAVVVAGGVVTITGEWESEPDSPGF